MGATPVNDIFGAEMAQVSSLYRLETITTNFLPDWLSRRWTRIIIAI